jgi:hypothetical protein
MAEQTCATGNLMATPVNTSQMAGDFVTIEMTPGTISDRALLRARGFCVHPDQPLLHNAIP